MKDVYNSADLDTTLSSSSLYPGGKCNINPLLLGVLALLYLVNPLLISISHFLLRFSLFLHISHRIAEMTCYDPQGNDISGGVSPAFFPCNFSTSDGFVPCCQPDLGPCLPNLACSYGDDTFIRGGCTDFTFRSKNCPQFLLEPDTGELRLCVWYQF